MPLSAAHEPTLVEPGRHPLTGSVDVRATSKRHLPTQLTTRVASRKSEIEPHGPHCGTQSRQRSKPYWAMTGASRQNRQRWLFWLERPAAHPLSRGTLLSSASRVRRTAAAAELFSTFPLAPSSCADRSPVDVVFPGDTGAGKGLVASTTAAHSVWSSPRGASLQRCNIVWVGGPVVSCSVRLLALLSLSPRGPVYARRSGKGCGGSGNSGGKAVVGRGGGWDGGPAVERRDSQALHGREQVPPLSQVLHASPKGSRI